MSFKAKLWVKMFPHHPKKKQHQPAGRSLPSCGNRNVWWVDLHVLNYKTCPIEIEWISPTYHTWKIQCPTSHNDHHHYLGWPCSYYSDRDDFSKVGTILQQTPKSLALLSICIRPIGHTILHCRSSRRGLLIIHLCGQATYTKELLDRCPLAPCQNCHHDGEWCGLFQNSVKMCLNGQQGTWRWWTARDFFFFSSWSKRPRQLWTATLEAIALQQPALILLSSRLTQH